MSSKASNVTKTFGQTIILDNSKNILGSTAAAPLVLTPAPTSVATGSSVLSVAAVKSGLVSQTPEANSTLTLPTAEALLAAYPSAVVGASLKVGVINLAAATFNTTIAADSGSTMVGSGIVAPLGSKQFTIRFTDVTTGSEAYVVYAL